MKAIAHGHKAPALGVITGWPRHYRVDGVVLSFFSLIGAFLGECLPRISPDIRSNLSIDTNSAHLPILEDSSRPPALDWILC